MIDVKDAFESAKKYFKDMYGESIQGVALEEVELSDDESYWYITIGYMDSSQLVGPTGYQFSPFGPGRAYKIFKIDANNGKVMSMKVRNISK